MYVYVHMMLCMYVLYVLYVICPCFNTPLAVELVDIAWCTSPNQPCYVFAMLVESGSVALMEVKGSRIERLGVAKGIGATAGGTSGHVSMYTMDVY